MKALTVRQPYAQLIALGVKTIETRSWATNYRGPLLIHAGAAAPKEQDIGPWHVWNESGYVWWLDGRKGDPESANYFACPLGAIVASCKLVDCVAIIDVQKSGQVSLPYLAAGYDTLTYFDDPPAPEDRILDEEIPYGDFAPRRYAWMLEEIKPVERRCPACWGSGGDREDPEGRLSCWICKGHGRTQPIPAKGKLGLWNWEP
jgi:hypothetical protein